MPCTGIIFLSPPYSMPDTDPPPPPHPTLRNAPDKTLTRMLAGTAHADDADRGPGRGDPGGGVGRGRAAVAVHGEL
eukprot:2530725-Rhodomonas_salina.1